MFGNQSEVVFSPYFILIKDGGIGVGGVKSWVFNVELSVFILTKYRTAKVTKSIKQYPLPIKPYHLLITQYHLPIQQYHDLPIKQYHLESH